MATKSQSMQDEPRVVKQCQCGATIFQGPFPIGEIVNGELVPREYQYRCVGCNRTQTIDMMTDRIPPTPAVL